MMRLRLSLSQSRIPYGVLHLRPLAILVLLNICFFKTLFNPILPGGWALWPPYLEAVCAVTRLGLIFAGMPGHGFDIWFFEKSENIGRQRFLGVLER